MRGNYSIYLFYLGILVVVFIFIGLLLRLKKKSYEKNNANFSSNPENFGNVSVFFDRHNNVTVISYVKDMCGMGRATGSPMFLNMPYNSCILGQSVRAAMRKCEGGVPCSDTKLMANLGFKGWREFSDGKRSISVKYCKSTGIVLNATRRSEDGTYQMNYAVPGRVIPGICTDGELGEAIKKLIEKCTA
ncbi:hypothetical protein DFR58_11085 [Anaerobacterium chartisolvens]|uniref:Uncharacterized protein n=1 Tax=Anaerobacterium chartisolvens TaxID=1297424 RepID=A0A369B4X9_9FIRM|nr:hypothetical protein [Anaerobacterium chartisolvens]RCX16589.1 hypothetical protein DFR58_11085 [Anaerobacterium chartisolvens]